jgi:hypothetical protein
MTAANSNLPPPRRAPEFSIDPTKPMSDEQMTAWLLQNRADKQRERQRQIDEQEERLEFPAIIDAAEFSAKEIQRPREIISGVLHQGCKLALGGGSKTFKTWTLLDLAMSVAHGEPWLGFPTARARVCYLNLELPKWGFRDRLRAVARSREIVIQPDWFKIWNLRGHAAPFDELLPRLAGDLKGFGLLILDPIYRIYGDADENSARDMAALLNQFEKLAQETGAATAFASHFAKGNAAGKDSIDRISGSGVFARDPDAILTFTRHTEEGAFTVDATLRNCAPVQPFVVRWEYPLFSRDDELDPTKLKKIQGRSPTYNVKTLLACLGKKQLTTTHLQKLCACECGMSRTQFFRLHGQAKESGAIVNAGKNKWQVPEVPEVPIETSGTNESHKSQYPLGTGTGTSGRKKGKATTE